MSADFANVWEHLSPEVWNQLTIHEKAPPDLFCELYREIVDRLIEKPTIEEIADIVGDIEKSAGAFYEVSASDFSGERFILDFLESSYDVMEDVGGEELSTEYSDLLSRFVIKYNLRYKIRPPCSLSPTLPGIFGTLMEELRDFSSQDTHLDGLMCDFEDAISDLRVDLSDSRIKTVMVKQINFLEAVARKHPLATENTIGAICNQVATWPHNSVRDAMKDVYKFACDYPGIRHAGTADSALRTIDMRDMLAMSVLLMGFVPYLTDNFDADLVYHGS